MDKNRAFFSRNCVKTISILVFFTAMFFFVAVKADASDIYIRRDCPANGNGSLWTCAESEGAAGALNNLPTTTCAPADYYWLRGTTYWLTGSDLSYNSICLRNSSGAGTLAIKKATDGDCSGQPGWDTITPAEKSKQALIPAAGSRSFSDFVLDGATGDGKNTTGYGIKISQWGGGLITAPSSYTHNNWTVRHVEISARGSANIWTCYEGSTWMCGAGFYVMGGSNFTFENNYIHHVAMCAQTNSVNNLVFRNNYCQYNDFDATHHNPMLVITGTKTGLIENNIFEDGEGTCGIGTPSSGVGPSIEDVIIRNNIFLQTSENPENRSGYGGEGIISTWGGQTAKNISIYNNTIVNFTRGLQAGIRYEQAGEVVNVQAKNNLWYCNQGAACLSAGFGGNVTTSHNAFYGNSMNVSEASPVTLASVSPFQNLASKDFRLKSCSGANCAVDAGENLLASWSNAQDKDGISRPQGAGWDIGAHEYISVSTDAVPPSSPINLRIL